MIEIASMSRARNLAVLWTVVALGTSACSTQNLSTDSRPAAMHASAGDSHAIEWSPALGLRNIGELDARLAAPFQDSVEMGRSGELVEARNCRSLLDLRAKGFEPYGGSLGYARERYFGAICIALQMLKSAVPAHTNHLAGFQLTPDSVDVLPPMLAISFIHSGDDAALEAEAKGLSWRDYEPGLRSRMDDDALVASGEGWEVRVRIYARGDFNGDGTNDVLVAANESATQGSYSSTRLLLLTRLKPGGKLSTVKRLQ